MGIAERRAREKDQRRNDILAAAWSVAEDGGWSIFSMERVAAKAELGRATVYGYFESVDVLVQTMADAALQLLSDQIASASGLAQALDAPLRFSQRSPAAFALLFQSPDARAAFGTPRLEELRDEARRMIGALHRLVEKQPNALPGDVSAARAFVAGIAMAGAMVPELRASTPLRRRWQDFCLAMEPRADGSREPPKK